VLFAVQLTSHGGFVALPAAVLKNFNYNLIIILITLSKRT